MKPHSRVAMTPGTAYGRKITVREKRANRTRGRSRSSANSSARPSVSGTATTPNRARRPSAASISGSLRAAT